MLIILLAYTGRYVPLGVRSASAASARDAVEGADIVVLDPNTVIVGPSSAIMR